MAINETALDAAPQDDDELARMLNNKALQDLMAQEEAGAPVEPRVVPEAPPVEMETRDMVPLAPEDEGLARTMPVPIPRDPALVKGGGLGAAQLPSLPGLPGGGSRFWESPLAAADLGKTMPSGLGQLIRKPTLPPGLSKVPAPALSRGVPGVPGSKAVGKGLSKLPGAKKISKGIGKLFGRR